MLLWNNITIQQLFQITCCSHNRKKSRHAITQFFFRETASRFQWYERSCIFFRDETVSADLSREYTESNDSSASSQCLQNWQHTQCLSTSYEQALCRSCHKAHSSLLKTIILFNALSQSKNDDFLQAGKRWLHQLQILKTYYAAQYNE